MGVLTLLLKVLVLILILTFLPGIPPIHVKFEAYSVKPALKLEGYLAPNSILNNARVLEVDKELESPESVSIRRDEIFVGDKSGKILKIKNGKVTTVAEFEFPCSHVGKKMCSFPLGTRFDPVSGKLVFTDIYGGLLQIDVDTGKLEKLVGRLQVINGAPVGFAEDVDVGKDGSIYWSDATTTGTFENIWNEVLGHPSGRLLKFEPARNKSTVLLKGLHFANGVQLSPKEDFVLVSEPLRYQIRRYYLSGEKKGQNDIFIDGLPGIPDNIRSNNKNGFYVSLIGPRIVALESVPKVRRFLARILFILDYLTSALYNIFPSEITKSLNGLVTSVTTVIVDKTWNGFVVELNQKGEIIGSLQSTNLALYGIGQITVGEKYSYLVGPGNTKVWVVDTMDLLKTN